MRHGTKTNKSKIISDASSGSRKLCEKLRVQKHPRISSDLYKRTSLPAKSIRRDIHRSGNNINRQTDRNFNSQKQPNIRRRPKQNTSPMNHQIKALEIFTKQISKLDTSSKRIIHNKIQLIKQNPYRFKRIHSKKYSKVFRVRLNLQQKETRLIYTIVEPSIILICLLNRKNDYKDLEKYLKDI